MRIALLGTRGIPANYGGFETFAAQAAEALSYCLMAMAAAGHRAALVFCVQRDDVAELRPADAIDPVYGRTLREALEAGVEVLAYRARVTTRSVGIAERIAVVCP